MKPYVSLLCLAALIGCQATASDQQFVGPSGAKIAVAKCSQSPSVCYQKAAATCGGGSYQVLSSESHAGGLVADALPGPVTWYSMSYTCGPSDGQLPDFPFRGPSTGEAMANAATLGRSTAPQTTTDCVRYGNRVSCTSY